MNPMTKIPGNPICSKNTYLIFAVLFFLASCKEKPGIPTLTTTAVTGITRTTAISGGSISDNGGAEIIDRGICWNTSQNPTTGSEKNTSGSGNGSFISSLSGLSPDTKYFVRAYATNKEGTAYGNELTFTTTPVILPELTTDNVTSVTSSAAIGGGTVVSDGGGVITARGVCWNTSSDPTTSNDKTVETGNTGAFTSSLTDLLPSTLYYVRAYATNSMGTSYGSQVSFKTLPGEPLIRAIYNSMTFTNLSGGKWIWGQNISIGDTAYFTLSGDIDNYDIPWCASFSCCDNPDFNGLSISLHTIQTDISYKLLITGGLSGGAYFTDGFIKIPSGWVIDSVRNTSNNQDTGASFTITDRNIVFHSGTTYGGCVCSDCGRANISFYIRKQ